MRNAHAKKAVRLCRANDFGEELLRVAHVFEHLEAADGVVISGALDEMCAQRLRPEFVDRGGLSEMRVDAGVVGVRDDVAENAGAATDIQHTGAGRDRLRRDAEFLAKRRLGDEALPLLPGGHAPIERAVALARRVEEIEPGRRLPQAEAVHSGETRAHVRAKLDAPQIGQQTRRDPLHPSDRRSAGDGAKGDPLGICCGSQPGLRSMERPPSGTAAFSRSRRPRATATHIAWLGS